MDNLPKTLLALLNVANEQYSDFSWTSIEQNGKMRISLIWRNNEAKRNKSSATRRRDKRRYDDFIATKNNVAENVNVENSTSETDSSDDDSNSNLEMDVSVAEKLKNTPCRSPPQVVKSPVRQMNNKKQSSMKRCDGQSIIESACKKVTIDKPVEPS